MPLPLTSRTTSRVSLLDVAPLSRFEHSRRAGKGLSRVQPVGSVDVVGAFVPVCGLGLVTVAGGGALASTCFSALLVSRPPGVHRVRSFSFLSAIASAYVWQTYPHAPQSSCAIAAM